MWSETQTPVTNAGLTTPEERGDVTLIPSGSGVSFIVMHIPPESDLDGMGPDQRAEATLPVARTFPGAYELDTTKGYFMHGTDSMDWLVLLSGELTLLVDDGEVTLKPFDVIIQGGTNHGWVNRGSTPAVIAAVAVAAEPLDRSAYSGSVASEAAR